MPTPGSDERYTPAVNENYVYHYNGGALHVIHREAGVTAATIPDPAGRIVSSSYFGAPIIGDDGAVFVFSDDASSGWAYNSHEHRTDRVISKFDVQSFTWLWSTQETYRITPALAEGVLYTAKAWPPRMDAIDAQSGEVLWSWMPEDETDLMFHRNIVVTRNLLFISTNARVYAIDLATREAVWSYERGGSIAISADRTLYVAAGGSTSTGLLAAIRLNAGD